MTMIPFEMFNNINSLAKILSFFAMVHKFRITIVTKVDPSINVHLDYGSSIMFNKWRVGFYYYYMTNI